MAANITPIFVGTPWCAGASLAAVTACTTRAPTATGSMGGINAVALGVASTNGRRIDSITVKACSTSMTAPTAAQLVQVWVDDGTTAWLKTEITIAAQTPSTTAAAFETTINFSNFVIGAGEKLWISTTVTTTASTTALAVIASGGEF